MRISPRSFILDLLSTLKRGTMPVAALVEAGALFGIGAGSLRVALARLLASGQVSRDRRGRYRLAEGARPVAARVASWRDLGERTRRWDGSWVGVHPARTDPRDGRAERRGRERALRFLGFRTLADGLAVRPDNLRPDVDALRAELHALGLPTSDLVLQIRHLDGRTDDRARRLWDTAGLRAGHRQRARSLARSTVRLAGAPERIAMVESFLVGGRAVGELSLDPLLPEEICCGRERHALLAAMKQYDRLGRAAWASFLRRHDVPHLRGPLDSRIAMQARAGAAIDDSAVGGEEATLR